jgi:hypothetical protein
MPRLQRGTGVGTSDAGPLYALVSKSVTDTAHHHSNDPARTGDCGCGCHGAGDCEDAKKPANRARRSLIMGAGGVAFVATLGNRRAFAAGAECGPISNAGSLNPSGGGGASNCGGLSPGFWKNHIGCAGTALGFAEAPSKSSYTSDLNSFLSSSTLGNFLGNLASIDPSSAGESFAYAFCNPSSNASHWACAILNTLTPTFNPDYGYSLASLNAAILTASNQGVSASMILTAIETLENDAGTGSTGCTKMSITSC